MEHTQRCFLQWKIQPKKKTYLNAYNIDNVYILTTKSCLYCSRLLLQPKKNNIKIECWSQWKQKTMQFIFSEITFWFMIAFSLDNAYKYRLYENGTSVLNMSRKRERNHRRIICFAWQNDIQNKFISPNLNKYKHESVFDRCARFSQIKRFLFDLFFLSKIVYWMFLFI